MPTARKAEAIDELTERLKRAKTIVLTDYRGLPTPELNSLRKRLGEAGADYAVVKNTLLTIAAERAGVRGLEPVLEGPTAMAYSTEKDIEVARAIVDYIRISRSPLAIKGGVLGFEALSVERVQSLATLPPKEQLEAQLAGNIQGPLSGFVGLLNSALGELLRVLNEREKQLAPAGQ